MRRILWALSALAAALTAATLVDLWRLTASPSTSTASTATAWTTAATAATAWTTAASSWTAAWTAAEARTAPGSGARRRRWTVDAVGRRAAQRLHWLGNMLARERGRSEQRARWDTAVKDMSERGRSEEREGWDTALEDVSAGPAPVSTPAPVPAPAPALARVEIHVFAWRRTHALRRLWASLLAAERPVLRAIDVVVHIDGDALPAVVALVDSWTWPWGALTVHAERERRGLAEVRNDGEVGGTVSRAARCAACAQLEVSQNSFTHRAALRALPLLSPYSLALLALLPALFPALFPAPPFPSTDGHGRVARHGRYQWSGVVPRGRRGGVAAGVRVA